MLKQGQKQLRLGLNLFTTLSELEGPCSLLGFSKSSQRIIEYPKDSETLDLPFQHPVELSHYYQKL